MSQSNNRVLFTHGYFLSEDPKEKAIMRPYAPLGILYLSAWLEKEGIANEVFDTTFSDKERFKTFILKNDFPIIAFYTNLMTKVNVIESVKMIKKEKPQTLIVLGGPDVTYNIENYLNTGADVIVIGEGEETMSELAKFYMETSIREFGQIDGLAYRTSSGEVIKTPSRTKIKEIDELPFPNRSAIDFSKYLEVWKKRHGQSAMSVSTQRGCPYTCKWCSTAVYGQSYRRRSPALVVEELAFVKETYNPDTIWFVDDVFTVSHKWLSSFKQELENKKLKIPFECITRADRLSEEVLKTLKECGCFRVWIGAESGSQKIIDAMDRRVDVLHVRSMIRTARQIGIEAGTFIMLGYPGETIEDIEETVTHLVEANPNIFTITVAYPIKGTSLYNEIEPTLIQPLPWETSTDRDLDFKRTHSRQYYDFAVRYVTNKVNFHRLNTSEKKYSFSRFKYKMKTIFAKISLILSK